MELQFAGSCFPPTNNGGITISGLLSCVKLLGVFHLAVLGNYTLQSPILLQEFGGLQFAGEIVIFLKHAKSFLDWVYSYNHTS